MKEKILIVGGAGYVGSMLAKKLLKDGYKVRIFDLFIYDIQFQKNEDIELVKGDANNTIPKYIDENQHLLISLLYLDFDLYKPTKTAIEHFLPRMPGGSIIAFDEVNNPQWAGETKALLETLQLKNYELKSFNFEPNICYIKL